MSKKNILLFSLVTILSLGSPVFVSAEKYTLTIKGEPRTADGKIDLMYSAGSIVDGVETQGTINNDNGFFEVTNNFDSQKLVGGIMLANSMNVDVAGNCFYHSYNIMRTGDGFELSDAYDPDHKVITTTKETTIDLGILKEDMSNQVMVDFDVPVKFLAEDMSGNLVAENGGYAKFTGMSNSFKSNSRYKLTLTPEDNKQIIKEISTGSYCESTRLIKRGNYFIEEHFPSNSFPQIGFFRNIWLSILGLRMIVIIPLIVVLLAIIIIPVLIIRRKRTHNL